MSIMKIGGKSPSDTAVAVAVDANGCIKVKHIWETVVETLCYEVISDTTAHYYPSPSTNLDVSDFALISIRVNNRTDQPVNLLLADKGNYLLNSDGQYNQITVNAGAKVVITANDFACLNVIPEFSIRAKFTTAPTNSGRLEIFVNKKR